MLPLIKLEVWLSLLKSEKEQVVHLGLRIQWKGNKHIIIATLNEFQTIGVIYSEA